MQSSVEESRAAELSHLVSLQVGRRWAGFLRALGASLAAEADAAALQRLFLDAGRRFAAEHPVGPAETLAEVERVFTARFSELDWGFVTLAETPEALVVTHHCSPLRAAFGAAGEAFAPAFLEGVFGAWFRALGSSPLLTLRRLTGQDELGTYRFKLARADGA